MTTEPSQVVYESGVDVATLMLNRPHRLNAVTPAMLGADDPTAAHRLESRALA